MSEKTNRAAFVPLSPWLDGLPRNKRLWGCLLRAPKMNSRVGQRGLLLGDPPPPRPTWELLLVHSTSPRPGHRHKWSNSQDRHDCHLLLVSTDGPSISNWKIFSKCTVCGSESCPLYFASTLAGVRILSNPKSFYVFVFSRKRLPYENFTFRIISMSER